MLPSCFLRGRSSWLLLALVPVTALALYGLWPAGNTGNDPFTAPEVAVDLWPEQAEALDQAREILRLAREKHGPPHPITAEAHLYLACLLRDQRQLKEAAEAYDQVQQDLAEGGKPDHWLAREARQRLTALQVQVSDASQARAAHHQAWALFRRGQYLQAVAPARLALELRRQLGEAVAVDVADSLLLLGRLYLNRGEHHGQAAPVLKEARDLYSRILGSDHPLVASCLHELGTLQEDTGDFFLADQDYRQALSILSAARGELSAEYARVLNRQGRMHVVWWVTGAEGKLMRAQQIRKQILPLDHPDQAESLQDLGIVALGCFHYQNARRLLEQALVIRRKKLSSTHPDVGQTLSCLGRMLEEQGDHPGAHRYHRQALAILEQAHGRDHLRYADALGHAAWAYDEEFDNVRALSMYEQEQQIRLKAEADRHPDYAWCLYNLGAMRAYISLWNRLTYGDGQQFAEGAALDDFYAQGYRLMEQASTLLEELPNGTRLPIYAHILVIRAYHEYYNDYRLRGIDEAGNLLSRTKKIIDANGGKLHFAAANWMCGQTLYLLARGDRDGAQKMCQEALQMIAQRYGPYHPRWGLAGFGLEFEVGDRMGDFPRLERATLQLFAKHHQMLSDWPFAVNERAMIEWLNRIHRHLSTYVAFSATQSESDPYRRYGEVVAFRGAIAQRHAWERKAASHPKARNASLKVQQARHALARHALASPQASPQVWQDSLEHLLDTREDAEADLTAQCITLHPRTRPDPPALARKVQQGLPKGSLLIDYFRLKQPLPFQPHQGVRHWAWHLVAFLVRPDSPPQMISLGPLEPIEQAVHLWRKELQKDRYSPSAGIALRRLIWDPLQKGIAETRTVFVVPDGPLCSVPFAALPADDGSVLLEEYTFGYLPAAQILAEEATRPASPDTGLLVVGDIDYGTPGSRPAAPVMGLLGTVDPWDQLPAATLEAESIESLFRQTHPSASCNALQREGAHVPAFVQRLQQRPRYVHFAGHGFFVGDSEAARLGSDVPGAVSQMVQRHSMLLSGLVLAGANHPDWIEHPDQSILTAEAVSSLNLEGTDLVTLSACDTGLGSVAGGEGVMGLQRAFLNAGARSVVASLWKVDDAATSLLMKEFYERLWRGKRSKWEALRQAQLMVYRHPELVQSRRDYLVSRGIKKGGSKPLPAPSPGSTRNPPSLWAAFLITGGPQ